MDVSDHIAAQAHRPALVWARCRCRTPSKKHCLPCHGTAVGRELDLGMKGNVSAIITDGAVVPKKYDGKVSHTATA